MAPYGRAVKPPPHEDEAPQGAQLRAVATQLHRRFDSTATAAVVDLELQRALDKFSGAPIRTYVPILAEREVPAPGRSRHRVAVEVVLDAHRRGVP